jgi:hypothetical protein
VGVVRGDVASAAAKPFIARSDAPNTTLPLFPGSRLKFTQQNAFYAAECDGAPIAGGGTNHVYSLAIDRASDWYPVGFKRAKQPYSIRDNGHAPIALREPI